MQMIQTLLDLVYPRRCPHCHELLPFGRRYCACSDTSVFRVGKESCEHCGADRTVCLCEMPDAIRLPHRTAPFLYAGAVRTDLLAFKLQGERDRAKPLSRRMALRFAAVFPNAAIDVVSFVPITLRVQKERGFNQSELLAKGVAKQLFLPCEALLQKSAETIGQHELGAKDRLRNLQHAFCPRASSNIKGKTVLLCDDIKTTGATLQACADALFAAGAADVYCLCCAISDYPYSADPMLF